MTNIILDRISFSYGNNQIFEDFSAEFGSNKIYGIIGDNAIGKSTLLKLIAANLSIDKGLITYSIKGKQISKRMIFRELTFTAPYINFLPELSARENFKFLSKLRSQKINQAALDDLLKTFDLSQYIDMPIKRLSTGTINKIKFMSNMIFPSVFLLFDEVLSNLDDKSKGLVKDTINKHKDNKVIIITSHSKSEIDFCDFYYYL